MNFVTLTREFVLRSRWLDLSKKEDEFMTLEDLANMAQLQELWLSINHEMELRKMEEGILVQLTKMRHLRISLNMTGQFPQFPQFPVQMRAMRDLESLGKKSNSSSSHVIITGWNVGTSGIVA
ncbi:hypothetical protein SUGI_0232390 [Cryptomeria japonica]|nr:hypothetical protein SUGI_0232390 [Cryptomeria japonica]